MSSDLERLVSASPAVLYRLEWRPDEPLPEAYRHLEWADRASGCFVPTFCSERIRELAGFAPAECLDAGWWISQVHPEDREACLKAFERLWHEGRLSHSYRFRTKDGRTIWVQDELRLYRDEAGRPVEVIGSWLDVSEQHRLAETERTWMQHLRDVLDGMFDGIIVHQGFEVVYTNQVIRDMFHYGSLEDSIGLNVLDFVAPVSRRRCKAAIRWALKTRRPTGQIELFARDPESGREFPIEIATRIIPWDRDTALVTTVRDISRLREKQRMIERRDRQLRLLAEAGRRVYRAGSEDAVVRVLAETAREIVDADSGAAALVRGGAMRFREYLKGDEVVPIEVDFVEGQGVPGHVMRTRQPYVTDDAASDPHVIPEIQRRFGFRRLINVPILGRKGELYGCFEMHDRKDGKPFDEHDLEMLEGLAAVVADALESLRVLEQLRASEQRFRALFDQAFDGMVVIRDGRVELANRALAEKWGGEPEDLIGRPMLDFVHPDDRGLVQENYRKRMAGEHVDVYEIRLNDRKGRAVPVEIGGTIVRLDDGEAVDLAMVRDMSRQRELERQLVQAQKMEAIGTMAGGIAHDFNNMLAGMLGQLYLLRRHVQGDAKALERIRTIERTGERAATMIRQLLTFARRDTVELRPLDLAELIRDALRLQKVTLPENIRLDAAVADGPFPVRGEGAMLQQVLLNLLSNARDALEGRPDGEVRVRVDRPGQDKRPELLAGREVVMLEVADNGCGMDEKTRARIFDPFFTTKEVGKGTGLGMSMVLGAVETHNGEIQLDSRPGKGSTVRIFLPLLPEDHGRHPEDEAAVPKGGGELVLVADDEPMLAEILSEMIEDLGYRVLVAGDGREALALGEVHADELGLVLLDVVMPGLMGPEVAARLRERRADLPVVFHTGYGDRHEVEEWLGRPGVMLVRKPARPEHLADAIAGLLRSR